MELSKELSDMQIIKKIVTHPPLSEKEVEEAMVAIDKILVTATTNVVINNKLQAFKELEELTEIVIGLRNFLEYSQAPQKIKEGVLDILDMLFPNHRSIE